MYSAVETDGADTSIELCHTVLAGRRLSRAAYVADEVPALVLIVDDQHDVLVFPDAAVNEVSLDSSVVEAPSVCLGLNEPSSSDRVQLVLL